LTPSAGRGQFRQPKREALADEVERHGEQPFDEIWMTEVNRMMWERYGRGGCDLTRLFLEPLSPPTELVIEAAMRDERAADAYYYGFPHPESIVPALTDLNVARAFAGRHPQ
jgi:hypothetical protein